MPLKDHIVQSIKTLQIHGVHIKAFSIFLFKRLSGHATCYIIILKQCQTMDNAICGNFLLHVFNLPR